MGKTMLSAISQKHTLGHNFWTKAYTMMILVSNYVLRVKVGETGAGSNTGWL